MTTALETAQATKDKLDLTNSALAILVSDADNTAAAAASALLVAQGYVTSNTDPSQTASLAQAVVDKQAILDLANTDVLRVSLLSVIEAERLPLNDDVNLVLTVTLTDLAGNVSSDTVYEPATPLRKDLVSPADPLLSNVQQYINSTDTKFNFTLAAASESCTYNATLKDGSNTLTTTGTVDQNSAVNCVIELVNINASVFNTTRNAVGAAKSGVASTKLALANNTVDANTTSLTEAVSTAETVLANAIQAFDEKYAEIGLNYLKTLNAGNVTLSVVLTDTAGNSSTTDHSVAVEKITTLPSGHGVSLNQPFINLSNSSSFSFKLSNADMYATYSATLTDTGTGKVERLDQSITSASQDVTISSLTLLDGIITLKVVVVDAAGNKSNASVITVFKDTIAPTLLEFTAPSVLSSFANTLPTFTAEFSERMSNVNLLITNGSTSTVSMDNDTGNQTTWTFTYDADMRDEISSANYTFSLSGKDLATNDYSPAAIDVRTAVVNNSQPTVLLVTNPTINPDHNSFQSASIPDNDGGNKIIQFTGNFSEELSGTPQISINDGASVDMTATNNTTSAPTDLDPNATTQVQNKLVWTYDWTLPNVGSGSEATYTFVISGSNASNIPLATNSRTLIIDNKDPPAFTFAAESNFINKMNQSAWGFHLTCPDSVGASYEAKLVDSTATTPLEAKVNGIITSSAPLLVTFNLASLADGGAGLADGNINFSVKVVDEAGNSTLQNSTTAITKNTELPDDFTLNVLSQDAITYLNDDSSLEVSWTMPTDAKTFQLELLDGTPTPVVKQVAVATSGTTLFEDLSNLADGSLILRVTVTDTAGNSYVNERSDVLIKDSIAPVVTVSTSIVGEASRRSAKTGDVLRVSVSVVEDNNSDLSATNAILNARFGNDVNDYPFTFQAGGATVGNVTEYWYDYTVTDLTPNATPNGEVKVQDFTVTDLALNDTNVTAGVSGLVVDNNVGTVELIKAVNTGNPNYVQVLLNTPLDMSSQPTVTLSASGNDGLNPVENSGSGKVYQLEPVVVLDLDLATDDSQNKLGATQPQIDNGQLIQISLIPASSQNNLSYITNTDMDYLQLSIDGQNKSGIPVNVSAVNVNANTVDNVEPLVTLINMDGWTSKHSDGSYVALRNNQQTVNVEFSEAMAGGVSKPSLTIVYDPDTDDSTPETVVDLIPLRDNDMFWKYTWVSNAATKQVRSGTMFINSCTDLAGNTNSVGSASGANSLRFKLI